MFANISSESFEGGLEVPSTCKVIVGLKMFGLLVLCPQDCLEAEHFVSLHQVGPSRLGIRRSNAPRYDLDRDFRARACACLDAVHSIFHYVYSLLAGAVVKKDLLLPQNVVEPLDRVLLVKVGDSVSVLRLDITDVSVAARSKVGVETYKRLGTTIIEVDDNSHTQMLVVFSGDELDALEDGHLDCFVAVRVVRLLCPFCRLEGGVLSTFFNVLHDSAESPCSFNLPLRDEPRFSSLSNRVNKFGIIALDVC